jgi:hypothetical protein
VSAARVIEAERVVIDAAEALADTPREDDDEFFEAEEALFASVRQLRAERARGASLALDQPDPRPVDLGARRAAAALKKLGYSVHPSAPADLIQADHADRPRPAAAEDGRRREAEAPASAPAVAELEAAKVALAIEPVAAADAYLARLLEEDDEP